jgi:OOP family OmpA-OmpF porin
MRKYVAPVLAAIMMVGVVASATGCKASASAQIGEGAPKPPPPPPPPPKVEPPPPPKPEPPKPAEPQKKEFAMEKGALKLPGPVVFETGSDKLKPESDTVLQFVKDYLDAKQDITLLRIEGHTDNDGIATANQTLSEKRALAVSRWLVGKGIDCHRLLPVGFGQTRPTVGTATAQTREEQAQNRRTAFVNAAIKGKPVGGLAVDAGGKVAGDPCK